MYDRVLGRMRERIRTRQYVTTLHGEEEMDNDTLSIFDIESVILTGKIIARQKDITTAQWKYLVKGQTLASDVAVAVGRLSSTDRLVIITVYRE